MSKSARLSSKFRDVEFLKSLYILFVSAIFGLLVWGSVDWLKFSFLSALLAFLSSVWKFYVLKDRDGVVFSFAKRYFISSFIVTIVNYLFFPSLLVKVGISDSYISTFLLVVILNFLVSALRRFGTLRIVFVWVMAILAFVFTKFIEVDITNFLSIQFLGILSVVLCTWKLFSR